MPDQTSKPIAIQLYSLRHLEQPLSQTLHQIADIGYHGIETIGNHGLSAGEMKDLLDANNLIACSTHVPLSSLEGELGRVIAFNQAIGNDCLVLPALPQEERPVDAAGWLQMGRRLDAIGKHCTDSEMRLLYHNHDWEMVELDGKLALDWLFEGASPDNLRWEPDIAWIVRGEVDPVKLLMRYSGRCPRIHVKDIAPEGENEDQMGFADVGHGVLDWSVLLPAAKAAGGEWFIVEHDLPKDPVTTVRRSFAFLNEELE
jgi:sugar phosphate isomerase/epimerase